MNAGSGAGEDKIFFNLLFCYMFACAHQHGLQRRSISCNGAPMCACRRLHQQESGMQEEGGQEGGGAVAGRRARAGEARRGGQDADRATRSARDAKRAVRCGAPRGSIMQRRLLLGAWRDAHHHLLKLCFMERRLKTTYGYFQMPCLIFSSGTLHCVGMGQALCASYAAWRRAVTCIQVIPWYEPIQHGV